MSKQALKRELSGLTAPQLVEVIMDAYASRAEIKEYFEYYLNPDVERLRQKYMKPVEREFRRSKRRMCGARVSHVTKALKQFRSFSPGAESEVTYMLDILRVMAAAERMVDFSDIQWNLVSRLVVDILDTADRAGIADRAVIPLMRMTADDNTDTTRYFKRALRDASLGYRSNLNK